MTILIQPRPRKIRKSTILTVLPPILMGIDFSSFRRQEYTDGMMSALAAKSGSFPLQRFKLNKKEGLFLIVTPDNTNLQGDSDLEKRLKKLKIRPSLGIEVMYYRVPFVSFGNSDYDSHEGRFVRKVAQEIIDRWDAVQKCVVVLDGYSVAYPYEIVRTEEPQ